MRNIVLSLAAVAAVSTFAFPAAAQQNAMLAAPQAQDGSGSSGTAAPRARAPTGGDRVICTRFDSGASRITRRVCRTQQEWQERGEQEIANSR